MNRERPPPDPERQCVPDIASRGDFLTRIDRKGMILGGSLPTTCLVPVQPRVTGNDVVKVVGIRGSVSVWVSQTSG